MPSVQNSSLGLYIGSKVGLSRSFIRGQFGQGEDLVKFVLDLFLVKLSENNFSAVGRRPFTLCIVDLGDYQVGRYPHC